MSEIQEKIAQARAEVEKANSIVVLTGAGISSESGVPTFRGQEGLWKNFKPEDLATPEAFWNDPKLVWEWYDWRRSSIKDAKPNPGHFALADMENRVTNFTLITQNVDGLHQMAGSKNIIEMHGNIWQIRCTKCGIIEESYEVPLPQLPPNCNACNSLSRPNVVWFGENLSMDVIDGALGAIELCDVMLIIGTSGVVEPAASMGLIAKQTGKTVIEINLEPTHNSAMFDITIQAKSGETLPLLYDTKSTVN